MSGLLAGHGGNITESQQFGDAVSGVFFMRVQVRVEEPRSAVEASLEVLAERYDMSWQLDEVGRPMRALVLVSKEGHCLTDLLFRQRSGRLAVDVRAVVSNHQHLAATAGFYGVPFHHLPVRAEAKASAEQALLDLIAAEDVELVVLARYMQVLSSELCGPLAGRIINIHHSFLPSFKGARPYAQAHALGVKLIGATAHYVTADLDEGPIIEQDVERVDHADDVAEMMAIGQDVERRVLARAVRWHTERRVLLDGRRTVVFR